MRVKDASFLIEGQICLSVKNIACYYFLFATSEQEVNNSALLKATKVHH